MTQPACSADTLQTHAFQPDWRHMARINLRIQYVSLAILLFLIYLVVTSPRTDVEISLWITGCYVFFAAMAVACLYRIKQNSVVLTVGPAGVSFPISNIGPISWKDVKRIKVVRIHGRTKITAIRFYFSKGVMKRRQFGSFRKNRREVIYSIKGRRGREIYPIIGGAEALLNSIERYGVVEGR